MTGFEIAASASRAIILAATMLVAGTIVFDRWVVPAIGNSDISLASVRERLTASSARLGTIAAIAALAGEIARICIQTSVLASGDPWLPMARAVLFGTSWGKGWTVGLAGALLFITRALLKPGRTRSALSISGPVCLLLSPSLTGHAIASEHHAVLAMTADTLHVLAASTWLGTLGVIFLTVLWTSSSQDHRVAQSVQPMVLAFSPAALCGAGLLVLSGSVGAFIQLSTLSELWTTTYGELLLAKIGLFLIIMLLGAYNWKRITPRLSDAGGVAALRQSTMFELLVGAITVCVTAVFVGTSPM